MVFTLLTNPKLGGCNPELSYPWIGCDDRFEFLHKLSDFLNEWQPKNQLIFYYSGHGGILGDQYCLQLGKSDKDYLPFDSILNELKKERVKKAIIILDSCWSGAAIDAMTRSKDSNGIIERLKETKLPDGIAVLASSHSSETSHEMPDGSSSIFTDLFCEGIETGLGGKATTNGVITISDIVDYIKEKLKNDERFSGLSQRPKYSIFSADDTMWISYNTTDTKSRHTSPQRELRWGEELRVFYENTPPDNHPCLNATIDDLDWELIFKYYQHIFPDSDPSELSEKELLEALKMFSPILSSGEKLLSRSVVLCFAKRPDLCYGFAKSLFVIGDISNIQYVRKEITGPISLQFQTLHRNATSELSNVSMHSQNGVVRQELPEIDSLLIRELISNALVHRNYDLPGTVTVSITATDLEIKSPGGFPSDASWTALLESDAPISKPTNTQISHYFSHLLGFEGVGRGFAIVKQYLKDNGADSITYSELPGNITCIRVKRRSLISAETIIHQALPVVSADPQALRQAYLSQVYETARTLQLAGIDPKAASESKSNLNLAAVYTGLLTQTPEEHERREQQARLERPDREERKLSALEQLNRHNRLVLLGDPGSGKTTFVNFVALCLAGEALGNPESNLKLLTTPLPQSEDDARRDKKAAPQPWDHGELLPVRVILRDFAARGLPPVGEQATSRHLWDFIAAELKAAGLEDFTPHLRKELQEQGGLLLVDGLDEVPGAEQRRVQIKQAVEQFARSFPKCRMLVTSRIYAYQKQEWQLNDFTVTTLAPFIPEQIRHFIDLWYAHIAVVRQQNQEDARGRAELLKREVFRNDRLMALAVRPLLLTLMASLHAWRGGNLPEKREALYADTVNLLLDWWESPKTVRDGRGQPVMQQPALAEWLRVDRDRVRELIEELAYEAHRSQPNLTGTADISQSRLVEGLMQLTQNPDVNPARLIEYLSNRAGLLLPRGVGVFTFPHRTFQEYLAACYLTRHMEPEVIAALACADVDRWREVTLLAVARATEGMAAGFWAIIDNLCPESLPPDCREDAKLWGAHLAGQALVESINLDRVSERNRQKANRVRDGLLTIVQQGKLPTRERALAGNHLAVLGDPRFRTDAFYLPDEPLQGFIHIPAGWFIMGSDKKKDSKAYDDEQPQHEVELGEYYIARCPVTVAQFKAFVESSKYKPQYPESLLGLPNHPVVRVTWYDALAYCDWLTAQLPRLPDLPPELKRGWRVALPSEAEWERAVRGTDGRIYPWGNEFDPNKANVDVTGIGGTSAVGCFPLGASPAGLLDASGNIWEWTRSLWGQDSGKPKFTYPYCERLQQREDLKANNRLFRIIRGGSWNFDLWFARCATRGWSLPNTKDSSYGFRISLCEAS